MGSRELDKSKHTIESQKPKRREHKHKIKGNHQTTKRKKKKKERKEEETINWKTRSEMATNTYV